ncbi:hypothetical protein AYO40_06745 [Planctomycetaceae bacterium SCGC AG-212-D15]|nr:hypothetical protein AYO40_06745 [Planctomycetaceae bacterium SCGC AG-212-D15]
MTAQGQQTPLVLVIDDDPAVHVLMQRALTPAGFRVASARTGPEALQLAGQARPDAITLDIMMPGLGGWSVLTALKSDPALASIPVAILSVLPDAELLFRLGVVDYLVKPVDDGRLAYVLDRYRSRAGSQSVLILTKDVPALEALHRQTIRFGRPTLLVSSGLDALYLIHMDRPGMVLLDLTLPGFDVLQVLGALRARENWRSIPVVGLIPSHLTLEQRRSLDSVVQQLLAKGGLHVDEFVLHLCSLLASRS